MARFNEILVGRFNRALQKLLSMKGPASLATLSDELFPVVPFFWGAENRYLESWDRYAISQAVGAQGVGNAAAARLRNPAASNVIAVVEAISAWNSGATDAPVLEISRTNVADLTILAQTLVALDGRSRAASSLMVSGGTRGALTQVVFQHVGLTNTIMQFVNTDFQEIPLTPGGTVQVASNNTNQGLTVNWIWRERFLEESERT